MVAEVSYFIVSDLDGDIHIESIHALVTTILKRFWLF